MAGENSPSRSRPRQAGFIGSLVALASALADFFESRAALFATESKAALVQFVLVALCLVAALLFFAFGRLSARDRGGGRRSSRKSLMAVDRRGRRRPAYF